MDKQNEWSQPHIEATRKDGKAKVYVELTPGLSRLAITKLLAYEIRAAEKDLRDAP